METLKVGVSIRKGDRNGRPLKNSSSALPISPQQNMNVLYVLTPKSLEHSTHLPTLSWASWNCLPMGAANWLASDIESSYTCTAQPCTEAPASIISHSDLYNSELSLLWLGTFLSDFRHISVPEHWVLRWWKAEEFNSLYLIAERQKW